MVNGPVFDAQVTAPRSDNLLRLNLTEKRVKNGTFGDAKIPKQFFKVMAYKVGSGLRTRAAVPQPRTGH